MTSASCHANHAPDDHSQQIWKAGQHPLGRNRRERAIWELTAFLCRPVADKYIMVDGAKEPYVPLTFPGAS